MLLSKNWLSQFVEISKLPSGEVAEQLTLSTVEIEEMVKPGAHLNKVVVGEIKEIKEHPNADNLKICITDIGEEKLQIICGGSNVKEGLKVAVAQLGAKVHWHGEDELVKIEETEIRGKKSEGMIVAAEEIGLAEKYPHKEDEIMDLSNIQAEIGTPLKEALNLKDVVYEIDNKSMTRRPDLWGHYGIARELAVLFDRELEDYSPDPITPKDNSDLKVEVQNSDFCNRYMAVSVSNVEVEESPKWLKDILRKVGIQPVNNVVDITNYVMMELGQPMHAFDKDKIDSNTILVRNAEEDESFTALTGEEYNLSSEDLIIADASEPIALAGIVGASNSEVDSSTKEIIFESANFSRTNVRKSAMRMGIRTDSSSRFEKGLDPHNAEPALRKAVELLKKICPQIEVNSQVIDKRHFNMDQGPIEVGIEYIRNKMGVDIDTERVKKILMDLGFEVKINNGIIYLKVPTWRATVDISGPEDIVEEVARIYGYNEIESTLPCLSIESPEMNSIKKLNYCVADILSSEADLSEVKNYSFVSPEAIEKLQRDSEKYIRLKNPIAEDKPYLRQNLFTNMLEDLDYNLDRFDEVGLFELGKIFDTDTQGLSLTLEDNEERLPGQENRLAVVYTSKGEKIPFFKVKAAFEDLLDHLNISCEYKQKKPDSGIFHPGRYAEILSEGRNLGFITELHPLTSEKFSINFRVGLLEVSLDELKRVESEEVYTPIPEYPPVERDIAFVIDKSVEHSEIVKTISDIDELIESLELFDVYEGEELGQDNKSMAYHIIYRSNQGTLSSKEVDEVHNRVQEELIKKFNAEIRK